MKRAAEASIGEASIKRQKLQTPELELESEPKSELKSEPKSELELRCRDAECKGHSIRSKDVGRLAVVKDALEFEPGCKSLALDADCVALSAILAYFALDRSYLPQEGFANSKDLGTVLEGWQVDFAIQTKVDWGKALALCDQLGADEETCRVITHIVVFVIKGSVIRYDRGHGQLWTHDGPIILKGFGTVCFSASLLKQLSLPPHLELKVAKWCVHPKQSMCYCHAFDPEDSLFTRLDLFGKFVCKRRLMDWASVVINSIQDIEQFVSTLNLDDCDCGCGIDYNPAPNFLEELSNSSRHSVIFKMDPATWPLSKTYQSLTRFSISRDIVRMDLGSPERLEFALDLAQAVFATNSRPMAFALLRRLAEHFSREQLVRWAVDCTPGLAAADVEKELADLPDAFGQLNRRPRHNSSTLAFCAALWADDIKAARLVDRRAVDVECLMFACALKNAQGECRALAKSLCPKSKAGRRLRDDDLDEVRLLIEQFTCDPEHYIDEYQELKLHVMRERLGPRNYNGCTCSRQNPTGLHLMVSGSLSGPKLMQDFVDSHLFLVVMASHLFDALVNTSRQVSDYQRTLRECWKRLDTFWFIIDLARILGVDEKTAKEELRKRLAKLGLN